jgi:hypothetical protein
MILWSLTVSKARAKADCMQERWVARKLRICKKLNITGTTPLRYPGEGARRRLNRKLRHHWMDDGGVRREERTSGEVQTLHAVAEKLASPSSADMQSMQLIAATVRCKALGVGTAAQRLSTTRRPLLCRCRRCRSVAGGCAVCSVMVLRQRRLFNGQKRTGRAPSLVPTAPAVSPNSQFEHQLRQDKLTFQHILSVRLRHRPHSFTRPNNSTA